MLSKEDTVKIAETYAAEGFLCSESCLIALARCQGTENPLIPRIATGFGAGLGRSGEICGAVTGAVMGLSIKYGRDTVVPIKDRRPYWYANKLLENFRHEQGEVRCPNLLGLDISKFIDLAEFNRRNLWKSHCTRFIMNATEIAWEILAEDD